MGAGLDETGAIRLGGSQTIERRPPSPTENPPSKSFVPMISRNSQIPVMEVRILGEAIGQKQNHKRSWLQSLF